MKIVSRDIFVFQEKDFFSPIRDKVDYARLLVLTARKLILNIEPASITATCSLKLIVDKMSRVFFYQEDKYFSVAFPFTTIVDRRGNITLTSYAGKRIDSKNISAVIAILDNVQFRLNPSLIDFYIDPNGIESDGLFLLEEIFQFEPSYIRFDLDPVLQNGKLHPLNHLDINYSQYSTYKLGLKETITKKYFENLQNINTECSFVID